MDASRDFLVRERIDRENELLSHRTSWVVASQAFLLSAYANCVVGVAGEGTNRKAGKLELLTRLLPWTGMLSLFALLVTVVAALLTIRRLWGSVASCHPLRQTMVGDARLRAAGLAGPLLVPVVFLVTWTLLLMHGS